MTIRYDRVLGASARPVGAESGYPVPGPQNVTSEESATAAFFTSSCAWQSVVSQDFDVIVVGTGATAVAFVDQALKNNPNTRVLMLERGPFWLPEHFQNLPLPFMATMSSPPTTYPWARTRKMATEGPQFFQAGMIPVFGGRTSYWSAWCPTPTPELMRDWPEELIAVTQQPGFWDRARAFLHVQDMNTVQNGVYGGLQDQLDARLSANLGMIENAQSAVPAPIAVGVPDWTTTSFHKFSVVGALLSLGARQQALAAQGKGSALTIVDRCVVNRLLHDDEGLVIAIETSRGVVNVGGAKVVLGLGAIPPATLLQTSFGARLPNAGGRYTGHFMSHVTARVRRDAYAALKPLEIGASYIAGQDPNSKLQFHVQMSAFAESDPVGQAVTAYHNLPDAAAAPSLGQLLGSEDYVVFVCATLGEVGPNPESWVRPAAVAPDPAASVKLQLTLGPDEQALWDVLDEATWQALAAATTAPGGEPPAIEYWVDGPGGVGGGWQSAQPGPADIRQTIIVHEASMVWMGSDPASSVTGLDYRPHGVQNVYVTGGGLFPTSGSWNPTLTMCGLAQDLADRLCPPPTARCG